MGAGMSGLGDVEVYWGLIRREFSSSLADTISKLEQTEPPKTSGVQGGGRVLSGRSNYDSQVFLCYREHEWSVSHCVLMTWC